MHHLSNKSCFGSFTAVTHLYAHLPVLLCWFAASEGGEGKKKLTGAGGKGGKSTGGAAHKTPKTRWQQLNKLLFGWANTTFKINGKKLVPHSAVILKFMVRAAAA